MLAGTTLLIAAFAAGLVATLVLAAWLTPRTWWRRANARALAVLGIGTLGIGALLAWLFAPPPTQSIRPAAVAAFASPQRSYTVYRDLNLRAASGVGSRRVAVVPAGASITFTGLRDGDWWQVRAVVGGRELEGWASSLWLRRSDERPVGWAPPVPTRAEHDKPTPPAPSD